MIADDNSVKLLCQKIKLYFLKKFTHFQESNNRFAFDLIYAPILFDAFDKEGKRESLSLKFYKSEGLFTRDDDNCSDVYLIIPKESATIEILLKAFWPLVRKKRIDLSNKRYYYNSFGHAEPLTVEEFIKKFTDVLGPTGWSLHTTVSEYEVFGIVRYMFTFSFENVETEHLYLLTLCENKHTI